MASHVLIDDVQYGSQLLTAGSPVGADQVVQLRAAGALVVGQGTGPNSFAACFAAIPEVDRLKRRGDGPGVRLRMQRAYAESIHGQVITASAGFRSGVTVAEMAALGAELDDGAEVRTAPPRAARWWLYRGSTATPDGWSVVAAAGGGNFFRDLAGGMPGAAYIEQWLVDSATGDNENDGVNAPVKDFEEVLARFGSQTIAVESYVYLSGDFSTRSYVIDLTVAFGRTVGIVGTKSDPLLSTTLASSVVWAAATGAHGVYTLTGGPDLRPFEHAFIREPSGPRQGWKAAIKGSQAQLASGVFFANFGSQGDPTIAAEPVALDPLQVYRITKLGGNVDIRAHGFGNIVFQDIDLGAVGSDHSTRCVEGQIGFVACTMRGNDWLTACDNGFMVCCQTFDCRVYGRVATYSSVHDTAGGASLAVRGNGNLMILQRTMVLGAVAMGHDLGINQPSETGCATLNVQAPLAILYSMVDGVILNAMVEGMFLYRGRQTVTADDRIFVKNLVPAIPLAVGYRVQAGAGIFWAPGKAPTSYPVNGATGAAVADFKIGGTDKTAAEIEAASYMHPGNGAVVAVVA